MWYFDNIDLYCPEGRVLFNDPSHQFLPMTKLGIKTFDLLTNPIQWPSKVISVLMWGTIAYRQDCFFRDKTTKNHDVLGFFSSKNCNALFSFYIYIYIFIFVFHYLFLSALTCTHHSLNTVFIYFFIVIYYVHLDVKALKGTHAPRPWQHTTTSSFCVFSFLSCCSLSPFNPKSVPISHTLHIMESQAIEPAALLLQPSSIF